MSAPCPALVFVVTFEGRAGLPPATLDELREGWIEFLEVRGLECGGGDRDARYEYAVSSEAGQATNEDRVAVEAWLSTRNAVARWSVGELEASRRF